MNGITLDAGALIALDRQDRRILTLIARIGELRQRITIPATALAQAMRNPAKQALLSRLIRQPTTDLMPLDGPSATAVGRLLARTATYDIADAHVVICAQRFQQPVITTDPDDLRHLALDLPIISI